MAPFGSEVWFPGVKEEIELERVQLRYVKEVLRVNDSTTDEFVRGEVGLFELKRERDKSMLVWYGKLLMMGKERWARKVFDMEWMEVGIGVRHLKSWRSKVEELVMEYGLEEWVKQGSVNEVEWKEEVRNAVEARAIDVWKDGVRAGKKLNTYCRVKKEWGMEEYLEGVMGKGESLLVRFRSGSAAVREELGR